MKKVFKRRRMYRLKYGIEGPDTVEEAYAIDESNGNTLWRDAIANEWKKIMVAFDILVVGRNTESARKSRRRKSFAHCMTQKPPGFSE
jgi:hypothetical protein